MFCGSGSWRWVWGSWGWGGGGKQRRIGSKALREGEATFAGRGGRYEIKGGTIRRQEGNIRQVGEIFRQV
jgi:hypothetical protein